MDNPSPAALLEVIQFDKAPENLLLFFFGDSTSRIPNEEPDFIFFRRVIAEMDVSGRSVFDCVGYIIVDDLQYTILFGVQHTFVKSRQETDFYVRTQV